MTVSTANPVVEQALPDHTQLPFSDGAIVENLAELPQSLLLSDAIMPVMQQLHPDGRFAIGGNSGIYWKITNPPLDGCKAPDWYYVPNVPSSLGGQLRRSYVMWQEKEIPVILIEFVSGDGSEEHDQTPETGKFWVYERGIRAPYYVIWDVWRGRLEVFHLTRGRYVVMKPNKRGHYLIAPLGVEIGIWHGSCLSMDENWIRWYDSNGNLLLTGHEIAEQEKQRTEQQKQRAEQQKQRAEQQKQRADQLAAKLRSLGIDPDKV